MKQPESAVESTVETTMPAVILLLSGAVLVMVLALFYAMGWLTGT